MAKKSKKKKASTPAVPTVPTVNVPLVDVSAPVAPADYVSKNSAPAEYQVGTYVSPYEQQLNSALDKITNWSYDPMQDASYQALAKVYGARGNIAAKNSLADAAALNGGYGTSYAVSAAQQARNQYNQELAALIPDLESAAYNRASGTLSALRDADNTKYGRFRDTESDRQWKYTQDYAKYRDKESDDQWAWSQQYNKYRDMMGDYQWGVDFNNSNLLWAWQQNQALAQAAASSKKSSSGSGGGGGRGRSSGAGGSSGGGSANLGGLINKAKEENKKSNIFLPGVTKTLDIASNTLKKKK